MQSVIYQPERLRVQRSINACLKAVVHAHDQGRSAAHILERLEWLRSELKRLEVLS